MTRLRVALIHGSDRGGGAERSVVSLHRALRGIGHESTLFVGRRFTEEEGIVEIPYVRGLPGLRRMARTAERTLGLQDIYNPSFRGLEAHTRGNFDVLHFNSLWGTAGYADLGALPALTKDVPGVVTMRDNWLITGHCACFHDCQRWRTGCGSCPDLGLAPAILRDGTRINWRRKQAKVRRSRLHVVAISDWLRRQAEASPILAGTTITRIYNGIDLNVFRPATSGERAAARAAAGISEDDFVVLLAGQTVEGIRTGIATNHALAALRALEEEPRLRPLLVGRSSERVAKELGPRAIAIPFQEEPSAMARLFQLADVTLVCSEVEAFGRVAAESQACAVPVVAFGAGGLPEVVPNARGGVVVDVGDVAGLVQGMRRYLEDELARSGDGQLALEHVRTHFAQEHVARQYADLYEKMIAG